MSVERKTKSGSITVAHKTEQHRPEPQVDKSRNRQSSAPGPEDILFIMLTTRRMKKDELLITPTPRLPDPFMTS